MWSLDFTCEIIRKEASADDSLELKFRQVKHLRDTGRETGDPRRDLLLISYQAANRQSQGLSVRVGVVCPCLCQCQVLWWSRVIIPS